MEYLEIKENNNRYPKRLLNIRGHPKQIYVKGNYNLLNAEKAIAIVGARQCSQQGEIDAKYFANFLAAQNICIVSGMAIGIDAAAHIGAIRRTIAVLPSGFNKIYPKENVELYNKILENDGCVISQYSVDEEVNMKNFVNRNRIIAGLSQGVLVVEAKYRSGSSITAKYAKQQNKPIFCLPKDIYNKNGVGTNRLIQQGAMLVTRPEDILKYYEIAVINKNPRIKHVRNVEKEYQSVYNVIEYEPTNINTIINKSKKNIVEIMSILSILEIDGYIQKLQGNNYIRIKE